VKKVLGKPGFRIVMDVVRPDPRLVRELGDFSTCNIADAQGRFRVMDPQIKPIRPGTKLAGPAVTVLVRPGDNLMVQMAHEIDQPGDVIFVSTCFNTNTAVFGELMAHTLKAASLEGIVVDGAVRDTKELAEMGVKVFSRAVAASACDKDGPGEINVPIACGGVPVLPGDVVIGDDDGVVVVPREDLALVLEAVQAIARNESDRILEIKSGILFQPQIDETLRKKGIL